MAKVLCSASWCKENSEEVVIHIDVQPAPQPEQVQGTNEQNNEELADDTHDTHARPSPNNRGIKMLQLYFRFMYFIFISTFDENDLTRKIVVKALHWVIFVVLCLLSLLYSAEQIKDHTVGYIEPGQIVSHVELGFAILNGVLRLMFFYVVVFKHKELMQLFDVFANSKWSDDTIMNKAAKVIPYVLPILTILYGVLSSFFNIVVTGKWSPQKVLLRRAWEVGFTASFWTTGTLQNKTILNEFYDKFDNLTVQNALLGILGISTDLVNSIHLYSSSSILLLSSVSMYYATLNLDVPLNNKGVVDTLDGERRIKPKGKQAKKKEKQKRKQKKKVDKEKAQEIWREYTHLRRLSNMLEDTMGKLWRWMHIYNLLFGGDFLKRNLDGDNKDFDFALSCVQVVSMVLTYYFAVKSARKNKAFREWILRYYKDKTFVIIKEHRVDRNIILEDTANHPIGVGSDIFYIDDIFMFKFMSIIASYFLFIADQSLKETSNQN